VLQLNVSASPPFSCERSTVKLLMAGAAAVPETVVALGCVVTVAVTVAVGGVMVAGWVVATAMVGEGGSGVSVVASTVGDEVAVNSPASIVN
jgi:hypothetical protein